MTEIHLFDAAASLSATGTVSAPPCLAGLVAAPSGSAFFGVYQDDLLLRIGRFDRDARLIASAPIPPPPDGGDREWVVEVALARSRTSTAVAVLLAPVISGPLGETDRVLFFDPQSLDLLSDLSSPDGPCRGMASAGSHGVAVSCSSCVLRDIEASFPIPNPACFAGALPGRLAFRASDASLVAAELRGVVHYWEDTTDHRGAVAFVLDPRFGASDVFPWPGREGVFGVASFDLSAPAAAISLYDAKADRMLSDPIHIGFGPIARVRIDPAGTIWAMLPWSATLLRIKPR
jgi:hypothetical protein